MTGRRIRVDPREREAAAKSEDFLFATLLQSVVCALLLATAFALGQQWGMTEVRQCAARLLSEETGAAAVMAAVERAIRSEPLAMLRERLDAPIPPATEPTPEPPSPGEGQGGPLPARPVSAEPVSAARLVLSASAFCPVSGVISSPFGPRIHPISSEPDFHTGLDIAAPEGTPVAAAYPGRVLEVGESPSYGRFVLLDHGGFQTRYCHCKDVLVSPGGWAAQGDAIALVGSTGVSTGPHLHFDLMVGERYVDPGPIAQEWMS